MDELAINVEKTQYIKIRLSDEFFGIDIKYVDNIVRMQHITRVPQAPSYIKGVINLRGEVIPVFSLRLKMGLEEVEETKSFRIIILKYEGESVGIIVDEVREVANLAPDEIEKVNHKTTEGVQNFLSGIGKTDSSLISLLDINEIFSEK